MATLARLLIEASLDPDGISKGLIQAAKYVDAFEKGLNRVNARRLQFKPEFKERVAQSTIARQFLSPLEEAFETGTAAVQEKLYRGIFNETRAKQESVKLAKEFNTNLLKALDQLDTGFKKTGGLFPELRAQIVGMLKKAGLDATNGLAQQFGAAGSKAQRAFTINFKKNKIFDTISPDQQKLITSILGGAFSRMDATVADLRTKLASGLINEREFEAKGALAAKRFDRGIINAMKNLQAKGLLTSDMSKILTDNFASVSKRIQRLLGNIGVTASASINKAIVQPFQRKATFRNLSPQGKQIANQLLEGLDQQFQAKMGRLKELLESNLISIGAFRRTQQKISNEFDRGIAQGMQNLRAQGLLTPELSRALEDQFKLAGLRAANSFQLSLDKQLGQNIGSIGQTFTTMFTLPVAAGAVAALKLGADFELSMNRIQSILQPTEAAMVALSKQAREIGASTQFSAKDAAQAQERFASQTQSTVKTMESMPIVTDLAAAALVSMTEAADNVLDVLYAFDLGVQDTALAVDQMVGVSLLARTSINDIADAFRYAGPFARRAEQDFTTVNAAIAALSRAGLRGTTGGTALRGIFTRLVAPTSRAAKAMRDMRIEVRDAAGGMLPMVDILKQFEDAQKRLSRKSFQAGLTRIFESRAGTGFSVLLQLGSKGMEELEAKLEAMGGTADRVGKAQMKGLTGAFREFINSIQELALAVVQSGLLRFFTDLIRKVADIIRVISEMNPKFLKFVTNMLLLAATIGPLLMGLGRMLTMWATWVAILRLLNGPAALGGLLSLVVRGGPLLIGLAVAAAFITKFAIAARLAKQEIADFTDSLSGLPETQLKAMERGLVQQIKLQKEYVKWLEGTESAAQRREREDAGLFGIGQADPMGARERGRMIEQMEKKLIAVRKALESPTKGGLSDLEQDVVDLLNGIKIFGEEELNFGGDEAADTFAEGVQRALKLVEMYGKQVNAIPEVIDRLAKAYDTVNARIAKQTDLTSEESIKLRELKAEMDAVFRVIRIVPISADPRQLQEVLEELNKTVPLKTSIQLQVTPSFGPVGKFGQQGQFDSFIDQVKKRFDNAAKSAVGDFMQKEMADRTGNTRIADAAVISLTNSLGIMRAAERDLIEVLQQSNITNDERLKILQDIVDQYAKLGIQVNFSGKAVEKWAVAFDAVSTAIRGIKSVTKALSGMSDEVEAAIDSTADLFDALAAMSRANQMQAGSAKSLAQLSSMIGIIGSAVGILGQIFGQSESEKEYKEITRENNKQLNMLRLAIEDFRTTTFSTMTDFAAKLPLAFERIAKTMEFRTGIGKINNVVTKELAKLGITMAQLDAIAEEFGITIRDKNGELLPERFKDLSEAIELSIESLRKYGNTLDEQSARLELKRNVFNLDDTGIGEIQDQLELLETFAPNLADMFAGFDASTEAGRAQIEAALQALFTMLEEGILTREDFGELEGKDDLTRIIAAIADALDKLRDSADGVTESLLNVPSGFKIERARFNATLAEVTKGIDKIATSNPIPTTPDDLGVGIGTGTVNNDNSTTFVFTDGSIRIDAKDKTGEELFASIKDVARKKARTLGPLTKTADIMDF